MFNIGTTELILILLIVLILFGAGKLPEIGTALGKGIKGFKKAVQSDEADDGNNDRGGENGEQK